MAVRSCRVMLLSQCNFITEQAGTDISWPPALPLGAQRHAGPAPAALGHALPQLLLTGPPALRLRHSTEAATGAAQLRLRLWLCHQDALLILSPGDASCVLPQLRQEKPNLPREKK